jgi:hypothetical protein
VPCGLVRLAGGAVLWINFFYVGRSGHQAVACKGVRPRLGRVLSIRSGDDKPGCRSHRAGPETRTAFERRRPGRSASFRRRVDPFTSADIERRQVTGDESRKLKSGDRFFWRDDAKNQGTVRGTSWSGVTIDWDDGDTTSVSHNDMAQINRAAS